MQAPKKFAVRAESEGFDAEKVMSDLSEKVAPILLVMQWLTGQSPVLSLSLSLSLSLFYCPLCIDHAPQP